MENEDSIDTIRRKALDSYELWDNLTKFFIGLVALAEVGLGIALIWLTDFSDPVQRLVFLAVVTIYAPLGLFLLTIAYRVERNTESILRAIDLLRQQEEE